MAKRTKPMQYDVHPGVAMVMKWVEDLPKKTGRSLDQWIDFIRAHGPKDMAARRQWLKEVHDLGTNTAWWLAERVDGGPTWDESPESYLAAAPRYVDEMFAGGKAHLRPLGDALLTLARKLGKDIRICPCQTIVPIYRKHVIAQVKPSTQTRIDFGFALGPDTKFSARLKDTGGLKKKDRITHAVAVSTMDDIDDELEGWLRTAYERDGK